MNGYIILILFLLGFMIWMVKYLEKKLPQRDKRKQKEWEVQQTAKEKFKEHHKKHDLEIQKIKKARENIKRYHANVQKGSEYENFIARKYEQDGYYVKRHGEEKGRANKGIDLIAVKNKAVHLIQCKNWEKMIMKHIHIKEFLANTEIFLENDFNLADGYEVKRVLVTSNNTLDNSAQMALKNIQVIEHLVIPMDK